MFIRTANQQPLVHQAGGYRRFVEMVIRRNWLVNIEIPWDEPRGEIRAEVVRSSWRVKCPFCAGALVIEPGEPFFCVDCLMQGNGFYPMRVIWPSMRQAIENVLLQRPNPATRNWLPDAGETLEFLRVENQQHGHGVS
jgi:hypothetical protein